MTNREIDALIAEKVFGLVLVDVPFVPLAIKATEVLTDAAYAEYRKAYPRGSYCPQPYLKYSTDPAASKQLRDRMRELGWTWLLRAPIMGQGFYAMFTKPNDMRVTSFIVNPITLDMVDVSPEPSVFMGHAEAGTEEMAVALAALKALC